MTDYVTWSEEALTADDTDFQITFPYVMYQNKETGNTMEYGTVCLEPVTTLTLSIKNSIVYGDMNGDGLINSTDAAIIYRYANGKISFTEAQIAAADVNGDSVVNSSDAALVYRMANGKLDVFPAAQ